MSHITGGIEVASPGEVELLGASALLANVEGSAGRRLRRACVEDSSDTDSTGTFGEPTGFARHWHGARTAGLVGCE